MNKSARSLSGALALALVLGGCAAVHTSITKRELNVQTRMSDTIFLDPVEPNQKVIYMNIRNTSGKTNFDIGPTVAQSLQSRGYHITSNPKEAHYWLQVNVLSVEKASPTAAEAALRAGYGGLGSVALGTAVGAAAGAGIDGWNGAGIGGLAGAAAFGIADTIVSAAVEDVTFMAITDVEIAERTEDGVIVREDRQQDANQDVGDSRRQTSTRVSEMSKFRTRVVSIANKVNLQYEEAAPELTNGLARSISGLF